MEKKLWIFLTCCLFIMGLGCEQVLCGCLPPDQEQPKRKQEVSLNLQVRSHELNISASHGFGGLIN